MIPARHHLFFVSAAAAVAAPWYSATLPAMLGSALLMSLAVVLAWHTPRGRVWAGTVIVIAGLSAVAAVAVRSTHPPLAETQQQRREQANRLHGVYPDPQFVEAVKTAIDIESALLAPTDSDAATDSP